MPRFIPRLISVCTACAVGISSAAACPYCESEVGKHVAAGIFNDNFWHNAALTLLPIPVLLMIVALIHFGFPEEGGFARVSDAEPDDMAAARQTERK